MTDPTTRQDRPPLGITFPLQGLTGVSEVAGLTREAEEVGFSSVWIPEAWGRDAFTLLAVLADRTSSIRLATGIVNVFSRTPAIVAQSAATLDDISEGRAVLGLGVSGPRVIERWHGLRFEALLQRTREYVDIVRLILSGARVDYEGEIFKLHDFRLGFSPPRSTIPIYLAAIGPANVRLCGEIGDGWLPIFANSVLLQEGALWLAEGAQQAGRSAEDVMRAAYIPTLVGPEGRRLVQRQIAAYIGGMGSFYYRLMVRSGWRNQADTIRQLWTSGDSRAASLAVDDAMLREMAIIGDREEARLQLTKMRELGLNEPILAIPEGSTVTAIRATLEALSGH